MTKNEIIDQAREQLVAFYKKNGPKFAADLERIIGKGVFDVATIKEQLTALGWDREITAAMGEFNALFKLSEKQMKKLGVSFLWTAQNDLYFEEMLKMKGNELLGLSKGKFAADMTDYAMKAKLSGKTRKDIITEVSERFATEGRRLGTEVDTALSSFDRASKKMLYDNAGVERFVYVGPLDDHTRDECAAVMRDSRQQTGWTREEIASSPVDFVTGGGYNCRHDWLPFAPETEKIAEEVIGTADES